MKDLINELYVMSKAKTQREFALMIDEDYTIIGQYLKGRRNPGLSKFGSWCDNLNVKIKLEGAEHRKSKLTDKL